MSTQDMLVLAEAHFGQIDPDLARLLKTAQGSQSPIVLPTKALHSSYMRNLCKSIISQQISTHAAAAVWARYEGLIGDINNPRSILLQSIESLRGVGLSRQKASYILGIAQAVLDETISFDLFDAMTDDQITAELVKLKGIGVWSAQMYLLFSMARSDIFSIGDLGLRNALKKLLGRPAMTDDEIEVYASRWSPYRSIASLVLWHSLENKPK